MINKYMKILSCDEFYDLNINNDDIACIFLVDHYSAGSYIWKIDDNKNKLKKFKTLKEIDNHRLKTLQDAPRIPINDETFNKIIKINDASLISSISKNTFLKYLGLYEWII
jgi:hypothetical protein